MEERNNIQIYEINTAAKGSVSEDMRNQNRHSKKCVFRTLVDAGYSEYSVPSKSQYFGSLNS